MFPVQPPPAIIEEIYTDGGCSCFYQIREGVIREHFQHLQEKGVTMGFLWDVAMHVLDNKPDPKTLFVHWHMFPYVPREMPDRGSVVWRLMQDWGPTRNAVTMAVFWSNESPCGLSMGYFDPDITKWDFDDNGNPGL
ncbi:hypothetical protein N431DRAFT_479509 [Stipitochalara longipes BDJ]|nr:hypothetical protein N431DRAFT_479509 [Stipitochalara longipes BDJ]